MYRIARLLGFALRLVLRMFLRAAKEGLLLALFGCVAICGVQTAITIN